LSFVNELKRRNVLRVGTAYVVAAWLVIQIVETLFPIYGLSDASIRIVISILAIGLVPTLVFAWAFELTPEGLKKESEVDRSLSISAHTGRKLDRMIMVVLALALGYFAFDKFVLSESREATLVEKARQEGRAEANIESYGDQSIAVLPFVNMSDEPANEYFSQGLSEEILNLLAKIPDLKVIGRTSSFAFKGSNKDLRIIGETLGVKTLLEGSVRKSGERVRVNAQLINAADGSRIWSETYDRTMTYIFALQDDVAAAIINALKIHVGNTPTRGRPTENPEAYALFLKARVAANEFDMQDAETLLLKAIELDPNFAEAYELLSFVYWVIPSGTSVLESQRRMGEVAAQAIALDPDLVLARTYYDIAKPGPGIRLRTIAAFERAARERPYDPSILEGFTFLLTEFGYLQEAVAVAEQYLVLDPLAELANYHWPLTLYAFGRTEEAVAALEFANHSDFAPHLYRWAIEGVNLVENRTEITNAHLESWLNLNDYPNPTWFRELVSGARDPVTGQAYLDSRIPQIVSDLRKVDDFDWHNGLISLYLYFGYLDRYYELVLATDPVDTTWHPAGAHLWRSAIFRRLGSTAHPKYVEFAEMMGVIDIWEKRGPPDFCEKVDRRWDCE
jgi:TolB-like protein